MTGPERRLFFARLHLFPLLHQGRGQDVNATEACDSRWIVCDAGHVCLGPRLVAGSDDPATAAPSSGGFCTSSCFCSDFGSCSDSIFCSFHFDGPHAEAGSASSSALSWTGSGAVSGSYEYASASARPDPDTEEGCEEESKVRGSACIAGAGCVRRTGKLSASTAGLTPDS